MTRCLVTGVVMFIAAGLVCAMSYDLVAWKAPRVTDEEEAARLVNRYFASDDVLWKPEWQPKE